MIYHAALSILIEVMMKLDEYMASLPIERQKRINDRAAKLIARIKKQESKSNTPTAAS